jgi:hypothetical protein
MKPAFELVVPDTLTPSQQEAAAGYALDVVAIATEIGGSAEEAQTVFEMAMDIAATIMPSGEEPNLANVDECMTVMTNRWGAVATKELVELSNQAVARLGPDVRAWLNTPNEFGEKIGNSPAAVYALAAWQRGYTNMAPATAMAELTRIRGLKQYAQGDRLTLDHVNLLGKIAYRGDKNEVKPAQKAPYKTAKTMGREKLESELRTIRLSPGYSDRYAADHKALVNRINELMGQLYPDEG